jgi:poly-gamma-glutamate capsule biosynthesis protein CapA/YwtB (metallophosphatase superfamily)
VIRDNRLAALLTAVAVVSVAALGVRVATGEATAPAVIAVDVSTDEDTLSVVWLGDTMLGDAGEPVLAQKGDDWAFQRVRPLLDGDYVIANLEVPITELREPWNPDKEHSYQMRPEAASALRDAGVDALGLANNHSMDRGPTGLLDTMDHADAAGMTTFGAGLDLESAQRPLLLRSEVEALAVVTFGEYFGRDNTAARTRPGIPVLDVEGLERALAQARAAGADRVVAYVHWGDNYQPINPQQRYWAQEFASAGYDAVVGAGSHVAQPIEVLDGMPVVYSLGNFVFTTNGRYEKYDQPGRGLALTTHSEADGGLVLEVRCIANDNRVVQFQAQRCSRQQAAEFLPTLHPDLVMEGDAGSLRLPPRAEAR